MQPVSELGSVAVV